MQNNFFKKKDGAKPGEGKAVYMVILLLLLAACASTAVVSWLSSTGNNSSQNQSNIEAKLPPIDTADPQNDDLKQSSDSLTQKLQEEQKKANQTATPGTSDQPSSAKVEKTVFPTFQAPISGKTSMAFSMDQPVFSKTLQEWRTHSGVDVDADIGTAVAAAAAGDVQYVKNDPRYGVTVIVNHGHNVKTVYSNLSNELSVVEGQKVKAGDIIGSVGDTASFESLEVSHLHFEVLENNKPVDPLKHVSINE